TISPPIRIGIHHHHGHLFTGFGGTGVLPVPGSTGWKPGPFGRNAWEVAYVCANPVSPVTITSNVQSAFAAGLAIALHACAAICGADGWTGGTLGNRHACSANSRQTVVIQN